MTTAGSVFHHPAFVRFCLGDIATQLGTAIVIIIIPLIGITFLNATPLEIGILAASERLPFIIFSLIAGVSADKWERRLILFYANFLRFTLLLIIMVIVWSDALSVMTLAAMVFIVGIANVYFEVAYWTYIPALVPGQLVSKGNGALAAIAGGAELIGPAAGGLLLKIAGTPGALLLNSILFLIGTGMILTVPKNNPAPPKGTSQSSLSKIKQGIHALFHSPQLRRLVIIGAVWNIFACAATPQIMVYLTRTLGFTPTQVGLILGLQGFGGLIGALCAGRASERLGHGGSIMLGGMIYGLFTLAICTVMKSTDQDQLLIGVFLFCAGWGSSIGVVNIISLRQLVSPEFLLGRINASFRFITWGIMPPAALLGGALSQLINSRFVIICACLSGLALILYSLRSNRVILCLDTSPRHFNQNS
ncbi:major facilitator transporter [Pseudomonas poae RE*1-1-14]|uniref:MFS transporter n=1 Tax=Pseudomonas poae TaxID=200451 RepID=UPI0002AF512B|nr:MFS transporter [Pseudomonas poae]AGE24455.1 major facilitator transporter [Pseudomonas poae RE*1-1-14]